MQVTLNKDSWHYKYYSAMVGSKPPRTLCPYFWIMVALIIISPIVGSIFLIGKITSFISKGYNKLKPKKVKPSETYEETLARWDKERAAETKRYLFWGKVGDICFKLFKWVIIPVIGITILYVLSSSAYQMGWLVTLITISIILFLIGIMLSIYWLIDRYGEVVGGGFIRLVVTIFKFINPFNWKITMIIGEMIKAGYTKACPLIQWDENLEESKNNL
jgi:hypothetical protein